MSKNNEGQVGRQEHLIQCHVKCPSQTHLCQCATGTGSVGMAIQLAIGPVKNRSSGQPSPKGGPGSYKTQFLSSGLYGLEVGRLPSWTT